MSIEQKKYLKNLKLTKFKIFLCQSIIIISFLILWEVLVNKGILSSFIYSSPSRIVKTIIELINNNNFFIHIYITLKEVLIAFILGISLGFIIALILYEFKFII